MSMLLSLRFSWSATLLAALPATVAAQPVSPPRISVGAADAEAGRLIAVGMVGVFGPTLGAGTGLMGCALVAFLTKTHTSAPVLGVGCATAGAVVGTQWALRKLNMHQDDDLRRWGTTAGAVAGLWTAYVLVGAPIQENEGPMTSRDAMGVVAYAAFGAAGAVAGDLVAKPHARVVPVAGPDGGAGLRLDVRF